MVSLDIMHSKPGLYCIAGRRGVIFVEVDKAGKCFQLKPTTLERDGELKPGKWNLADIRNILGPLTVGKAMEMSKNLS